MTVEGSMARFKEFLDGAGDALAEHADALTAAYEEEAAGYSSELESASANISGMAASREAIEKEMTSANAGNWDIAKQVGSAAATVANHGGEEPDPEDDQPRGIDAMFGE